MDSKEDGVRKLVTDSDLRIEAYVSWRSIDRKEKKAAPQLCGMKGLRICSTLSCGVEYPTLSHTISTKLLGDS